MAPVLAPTCFPSAVHVFTYLTARARACVLVSVQPKTHHGWPRGNSAASLTDRLLAVNSFTPVKKHPTHLCRPLIQPTPSTSSGAPPHCHLNQHFPLPIFNLPLHLGCGGIVNFLEQHTSFANGGGGWLRWGLWGRDGSVGMSDHRPQTKSPWGPVVSFRAS